MKGLTIAVGTLNPVKIAATRAVLAKAWPHAHLIPVTVSSEVSDQPIDDEETVRGAINRALAARRKATAMIGIGLEGGISRRPFGIFTSEWCAVADSSEQVWLGGGANMPVPSAILEQLAYGLELGEVVDRLTGLRGSKSGPGTIGVLTGGLTNRQRCYEAVIAYALAPLISPQFYSYDKAIIIGAQPPIT